MKKNLVFRNKTIKVEYSTKAEEMAHKLTSPLVIEIQIYFSCMLGKRLAYYSGSPISGAYQLETNQFKKILEDSQQLTENIYVRFNIVMTIGCPVSDCIGPPPLTDFNIVGSEVYVPSWLNIDAKNGIFTGEYGWKSSQANLKNTRQIRDTLLQKRDYLRS
ncbi:MAG: hypothetical protein AB2806_02780 [Candidatus Thiodiazotropha sp.]